MEFKEIKVAKRGEQVEGSVNYPVSFSINLDQMPEISDMEFGGESEMTVKVRWIGESSAGEVKTATFNIEAYNIKEDGSENNDT